MKFDSAVSAIVPVTERGSSWVNSLFRLLAHPLLNFLTKIFYVISSNEQVQSVGELFLRTGVFRNDLAFFYEMYLCLQVLQRDGVAEVSIKTVGFFDQNNARVFGIF
ncbi:MAG TPA: hypothetical protein VD837_09270 [Terriglobales bacterium]|nr:hypothetical protein [Terriglobales bacterium]